jgi:hypothetical protein
VIIEAITYPMRVTVHVMFALANRWQAAPEPLDAGTWPEDDGWTPQAADNT